METSLAIYVGPLIVERPADDTDETADPCATALDRLDPADWRALAADVRQMAERRRA